MLLSSHALIMTLSLLAAPGDTAAAPKVTDEMLGRVIRERAVWENNRLGITNKIPPPKPPNVFAFLSGKFRWLILKQDPAITISYGNAGSGGSGKAASGQGD